MEQLLKELREQIKRVSSEDNLNTVLLEELMSAYRRLSGFVTASVSNIPMQGIPVMPVMNDVHGIPGNIALQERSDLRILIDIAKDSLLRKNKEPMVNSNIENYIWWYKFLDEYFENSELDERADKLKELLFEVIINKMNESLTKMLSDENEQLKNEIEKTKDEMTESLYNRGML